MLRKFNIVIVVVGAIALVFAWLINISVQTTLVPTIVNGEVIATSTAIIFTGIFFTLGCSNRLVELKKKKDHPFFILGLLGLTSFFVVSTFLCMIANNFDIALKLSFTGLILATGTFMSLIGLLIKQLTSQNSDSDNQQ
jgi:predicted MFS family arabinose efflux permease